MIELILFVMAFASDQLVKYWAVTQLSQMPGQTKPIIEGVLRFEYAENHADNVSFIRGRSGLMNLVRLLQVILVLYLLIKQRDKLAKITRFALVFFLAGLIGNQVNYFTINYVPDMFVLSIIDRIVFNVADVFVFIAMIILFVRLAFFEGQTFVSWLVEKSNDPAEDAPKIRQSEKDAESDLNNHK